MSLHVIFVYPYVVIYYSVASYLFLFELSSSQQRTKQSKHLKTYRCKNFYSKTFGKLLHFHVFYFEEKFFFIFHFPGNRSNLEELWLLLTVILSLGVGGILGGSAGDLDPEFNTRSGSSPSIRGLKPIRKRIFSPINIFSIPASSNSRGTSM
jgi:hypothetical protein